MHYSIIVAVAFFHSFGKEVPFPLRTDPPPKQWKLDEINNGLPYRWEKGTLHVLAWGVIEDSGVNVNRKSTQILVLKRFDQLTERGGCRWVLAVLYQRPDDQDWPWKREMIRLRPVLPGEKMPKVPDALIFGHEFYQELPTNKQLEDFLRDAGWRPTLGAREAWTISDGKAVTLKYTTTLTAGGVDRKVWRLVFERDVPFYLFPELKRPADEKK